MIGYNEYVISASGAFSYRIALPCFSGDGADFYRAARMNNFYSKVLDELYLRASSRSLIGVRRRSLSCSFNIRENGDFTAVDLILCERIVTQDSGSMCKKRKISHVWRDGVILKKAAV